MYFAVWSIFFKDSKRAVLFSAKNLFNDSLALSGEFFTELEIFNLEFWIQFFKFTLLLSNIFLVFHICVLLSIEATSDFVLLLLLLIVLFNLTSDCHNDCHIVLVLDWFFNIFVCNSIGKDFHILLLCAGFLLAKFSHHFFHWFCKPLCFIKGNIRPHISTHWVIIAPASSTDKPSGKSSVIISAPVQPIEPQSIWESVFVKSQLFLGIIFSQTFIPVIPPAKSAKLVM